MFKRNLSGSEGGTATATATAAAGPTSSTAGITASATAAAAYGLSRAALDSLVMDYLVVEGYRDAAAAFAIDSQQQPKVELSSVASRMQVIAMEYFIVNFSGRSETRRTISLKGASSRPT